MRSMEQSSRVVGAGRPRWKQGILILCVPKEATMRRTHHLHGIHKQRFTHFWMNPFSFAVTSQKVRGEGHRTAMFEKRVSPDGCNRWHMSPGSNGTVAALDGTKREKQRVQSFASLLAASVAPGDSPSSEGLSGSSELGSPYRPSTD